MNKPLLILQGGSVMPDVAARHGDCDAWFRRAFEPAGLRCRIVEVTAGAPPDPGDAAGILITGSLASAYADEPWILGLMEWIRAAAPLGIPTLGVCFGHQVLARALGGTVRRNPAGREAGTFEVRLTSEGAGDWLFDGVPGHFPAPLIHDDEVEVLPSGAVRLACNDHTPVQAFGLGGHLRGVQFHPEIDPSTLAAIMDCLSGAVPPGKYGFPKGPPMKPSPEAARVLVNFAGRVSRRGPAV